jgi:hypothetical protein
MGDMAEVWREWNAHKKERKQHNIKRPNHYSKIIKKLNYLLDF